jgi:hypothetical protein
LAFFAHLAALREISTHEWIVSRQDAKYRKEHAAQVVELPSAAYYFLSIHKISQA